MSRNDGAARRREEDAELGDRFALALSRAADTIDDTPRSFDPTNNVAPRLSQRRPRRPVWLAAAAIVVVGVTSAAVTMYTKADRDRAVITSDGEERQSEATSGDELLDPQFLDHLEEYLAPTNGDAWLAPSLAFYNERDEVQWAITARCLRSAGMAPPQPLRPIQITDLSTAEKLPALDAIERYGIYRVDVYPALPGGYSTEVSECVTKDRSAPVLEWLRQVGEAAIFFNSDVIGIIIERLETTSIWDDSASCMMQAGAPSETPTDFGRRKYETYVDWVESEEQKRVPEVTMRMSPEELETMAGPEAEAFSRCMRPFFVEVEKEQVEKRAEYLDQNRDRLSDWRRQFPSLSGPGG